MKKQRSIPRIEGDAEGLTRPMCCLNIVYTARYSYVNCLRLNQHLMPLLYISRYIIFIYAFRRTSVPSSGSLTFTVRYFGTTASCKHLSKRVGTRRSSY